MIRRFRRWRVRRALRAARWDALETARNTRAYEDATWFLLRESAAKRARGIGRRRWLHRVLRDAASKERVA